MGRAVKQVKGKGRRKGLGPKPDAKRKPKSPLDRATGYELEWEETADVFNRGREIINPSFVYFIGERDGGFLKIGKANDPINRLRSMQTGNARRLVIERVLFGDISVEKLLHELWEEFAVVSDRNKGSVKERGAGTEWFRPEIREELYPVVETAKLFQFDVLDFERNEDGGIEIENLERVVFEAHLKHQRVHNCHDETIFMAAGAGYVFNHRSRVQHWMRAA